MCGICGTINLDKKPVEKKVLQKMADALIHRGPDDEGFFVEKNIGLGHRRLSIIDLSKAGHQPMFYNNQNLVIVFNGEIYNYIEIHKELVKKGYKFKSKTDTEVILASYHEWGERCLQKFNGMWAFVIYDKKKKLIFAARDRLGVKPFYYYFDQDKFLFASEIKAILVHPEIKAQENEQIVWDYLICGLVDHGEETFFKGIKELRAGHYLVLRKKKIEIRKYWDLDPEAKTTFKKDSEYAEKFRELFADSVKLRLRSDVPIGTCLSGGLDSSAIVCVVNNFLKNQNKIEQIGLWQKTFSSVYDKKKYSGCDERQFINEVIRKTKVKSHLVFPDGKKLVREIEKVIYHQDYPFSSTSIYAQWNVFRLAKQNSVKVILDGQGADEQLAGYHPFFGIYFCQLLRDYRLGRLFYETYKYSKNHNNSVFKVLKDLFVNLGQKGVFGGFFSRFIKNQWSEYDLFLPEWRNKYQPPAMIQPTDNVFKNALHSGFKMGLVSLLRYEDRDSMAFSIESRVPFLDYRLIEFIYSLPDNQKINQGQTKWVMRQALKGILPEKIRNRQDKIGFATPEQIWMKNELGEEMKKVFASKRFNNRGYFEPGKTLEYFENYLKGDNTNYPLFWRLYCLEIWFRVFID
ncbi:MAG: Asparagine synthetase [Berkelbacteria bacterium GW2011_GWA1_36_9]|uniref:asparagine synthase (glutamine-hydrolyzing) n=1 Tax=Berkelbacteria bacterium GW2011_GWA1_36_9 TaxID=1618331 RepID=A0A0G0FY84_9BACT|nr:MAG: Asparagine synthetase [Berkelbacteria bacterium GW2011_GWA1_36_9]